MSEKRFTFEEWVWEFIRQSFNKISKDYEENMKRFQRNHKNIKEGFETMKILVSCQTCKHDFRDDDEHYGLVASFCKKGCKEYEPYKATECNKWESQR